MTEAASDSPGKTPGAGEVEAEAGGVFPRRFGKYTLIRKLAVGGMAELFLGIQRSMAGFEKLIVIKRVLPRLAEDEDFARMLLDEARIAATLNHPNIAHIYDVGVHDGQYYIAMEHIHGEDLRAIVKQMRVVNERAFPLEHTLAIALGCASGLAFAHEKKDLDGRPLLIVHRDVSPQNLLVTFTGDVKLVDFGIAKAGRSAMEETKSGKLKGKVPYMSPEQTQGGPLDARSDIFSLGIILFELSTGRRLFKGKGEYETMKMIVESEYPTPTSINPHLPVRLEQIIMRALRKDPSARYQSARELQSDLEDFVRAERMAVSPISLGEWMRHLFAERLSEQAELLTEGRALAKTVAKEVEQEEYTAAHTAATGIRPRRSSKLPWVLLAVVGALMLGVVVWALSSMSSSSPGRGTLTVTSEPEGAAIWIDGDRRSGRTPSQVDSLPTDAPFMLKLTKDGFAPFNQEVRFPGGQQAHEAHGVLEARLADSLAVARITSSPSSASVLLNGRAIEGETPVTVDSIEPGVQHNLVLSLDGYQSQTIPLTLSGGQNEVFHFELTREPLGEDESLILLTTDPADARVRILDEWHTTGSPFEFRVPGRTYRIEVTRPGYADSRTTVRAPGGEEKEVLITLRRRPGTERPEVQRPSMQPTGDPSPASNEPGRLTFDARPWCNVTIDGASVGQTPIANRQLSAGTHRITCHNPELNVRRQVTLTIRPGETTRRRLDLQ